MELIGKNEILKLQTGIIKTNLYYDLFDEFLNKW